MEPGKSPFLRDMTKEGCILIEDVPEPQLFVGSDFDVVPFLEDEERHLTILELRELAKEMHCDFGQRTAEHILVHENRIPEDFQKYNILCPGTAWQNPRGRLLIPYFYFLYSKWHLHFLGHNGDVWIPHARLLRLRK